MKVCIALALVLLLGVSAVVRADDIKIPNEDGLPGLRVDCDVTDCTLFSANVGQVLVTDQLYTFGPLSAPVGGAIIKVVLMIDINQTWVGDLVARLYYDADGNGSYDFGPVDALCRPNLAGACDFESCCGCSGDLSGTYTFGDDAVESLADPNCPASLTAGCYLPAPESAVTFAAAFAGAAGGGNFYLEIGDGAAGDDANLAAWGVYVRGAPVPIDNVTWGRIKSVYR